MIGLTEKQQAGMANINWATYKSRRKSGMSVEQALSTPVAGKIKVEAFNANPTGTGIKVTGFTVTKNSAREFIDRNLVPLLNALEAEYGTKDKAFQAGVRFLEEMQALRNTI